MKGRDHKLLAVLLGAMVVVCGLVLAFALRGGGEPGALDPALTLAAEEDASRYEPPAPSALAAPPAPERSPATERAPVAVEARPYAEASAPRATGRVRGTVVLEDGVTPAAGARVVLTRGPAEPDAAEIASALAAALPDTLATTDEKGEFELVGLDPEQSYTLVIGSDGRIGAQPRWVVRPDRPPQTYSLQRLFAAVVRMRERGGGPIRLHPGLTGSRLGRSRVELTNVYPIYGSPAGAVLAGVEGSLLQPDTLGVRLLLYKSDRAVDELGPIRFQANYPGYEQVDVEVRARFIPLGIPDFDIELQPTAAGFGSLRIDVRGWSGACPAFENPRGPAALLRLQSGRGELVTFELRTLGEEGGLVEGLPYGTWRAVVMLGSRLSSPVRRSDEEQEVVIGRAPARYELDLARSASLVLDVLDAQGAPYVGHVSFLYGFDGVDPRGWRTQHFLAPPYRVDELEPGNYRLVLQIPFAADTSPERPLLAPLRGGECTRVELRE